MVSVKKIFWKVAPKNSSSLLMGSSASVPQGIAQIAPPSKPFERFDGCVLEPDEWTDGDSFRVRLPDSRLETTTGSRSRVSKKQNARVSFGLYEPRSYTTFFR